MTSKINIIKESNLNRVRKALRESGTATKPRLAELTGLSVVTINSLVNTLLDTGEVLPDKMQNSESGRPAASYQYNSRFRMALVIYMHEYYGQDTAFFSVFDLQGELVEKVEQKLTDVFVDSFDLNIEKLLNKYQQIKVICFGIPGNEVNERLVISDYEKMLEQSLSGYISEKFHLPVCVENDINASVIGYCGRNSVQNNQCVIGLYFPEKYPPGAGIYLNGNIYRGRNGLAGEIKYLPLDIDWDSIDYKPEKSEDIIIKVIQAFMCMYNPDFIILYGENINSSLSVTIRRKCMHTVEKILFPEIVISADLNVDFEAGIKHIALSKIIPEQNPLNGGTSED